LFGLLNGLEVARWSLQQMQVKNAVHSASLAAWKACDTKKLPAKTKCSGLNDAITAGLNSTSLGTNVTLTSTAEGYYCVNGSGALVKVSEIASKPDDCSDAGDSTTTPGDYLIIVASYTYVPMFGNITIGGMLPSALNSTGYMRLV